MQTNQPRRQVPDLGNYGKSRTRLVCLPTTHLGAYLPRTADRDLYPTTGWRRCAGSVSDEVISERLFLLPAILLQYYNGRVPRSRGCGSLSSPSPNPSPFFQDLSGGSDDIVPVWCHINAALVSSTRDRHMLLNEEACINIVSQVLCGRHPAAR